MGVAAASKGAILLHGRPPKHTWLSAQAAPQRLRIVDERSHRRPTTHTPNERARGSKEKATDRESESEREREQKKKRANELVFRLHLEGTVSHRLPDSPTPSKLLLRSELRCSTESNCRPSASAVGGGSPPTTAHRFQTTRSAA